MPKEPIQTPEQLAAENAELKNRLAKIEAENTRAAKVNAGVAEKMASGLSRDQAESVIGEQAKHDAHMKAQKEKRAEKAEREAASK
jgi:hypothetical protein